MMDLVCGIDGGQTSTRCVLATTHGEILGQGRGGPLTHLNAEGGRERFIQSVDQALQKAWTATGLTACPLAAIVVGATGILANSPEASTATEFLSTLIQAQSVHVCSDAMTALQSAHEGRPGVIVIAGTGTIALGMDSSGHTARAGGWGWLIGDEGSAFAIGRAGLRAALYARDGMEPGTVLEDLFARHFGVSNLHDVKRIIYAPDFGAKGFAALAKVVSRAAEQGDGPARRLIREAGTALAHEAIAVIENLHFCESSTPVAPLGGAFEHVVGLRQAFASAVETASVPISITQAKMPAVLGAVIMALKQCDADLVSALPRLRATRSSFMEKS